jgi:uncharacterized circularly permuted ATP-grasp superfamily protein
VAKRTSLNRSKPRSLAAGYQPLPGVPDELMAEEGAIRPVWAPFLDYFSRLDQTELTGRFARGDEYLRDAGVYFRQYGQKGAVDRSWPLSHVPVILHESEWQTITAALTQRADLLELLAADLYGANTLVSNGFLPASIVASNPEWLRPLVGIQPANGRFLHFVAFDIGRGPGGQWWVLEDRSACALRRGLRAGEPRCHGTRILGLLCRRACASYGRLLPPVPRRAQRHARRR